MWIRYATLLPLLISLLSHGRRCSRAESGDLDASGTLMPILRGFTLQPLSLFLCDRSCGDAVVPPLSVTVVDVGGWLSRRRGDRVVTPPHPACYSLSQVPTGLCEWNADSFPSTMFC